MTALGSTKTFASSSNGCKCCAANASVAWIGCSWPWLPGTITANIRRSARKEKPKGKSRRRGGKAAVSSGSRAQVGFLLTVPSRPSARARAWQHLKQSGIWKIEIESGGVGSVSPLYLWAPYVKDEGKLVFKKILIANRGEIAIRVARTCRELGIHAIGIYSTADRDSLHRRYVDESVEIGPPPAIESYLSIARILTAAKDTDAEAIHPGYGFLAENPEFSQGGAEDDIVFVGPGPAAMAKTGDKIRARQAMAAAGLTITPGSASVRSEADATAAAKDLGLPVILKAAGGGGGIGMAVVHRTEEIPRAFRLAQSAAAAAF